MPKYKKKQAIVEAFCFSKSAYDSLQKKEFPTDSANYLYSQIYDEKGILYINNWQGRRVVADGDYIVTEVDGKILVCDAETFKQNYEAI